MSAVNIMHNSEHATLCVQHITDSKVHHPLQQHIPQTHSSDNFVWVYIAYLYIFPNPAVPWNMTISFKIAYYQYTTSHKICTEFVQSTNCLTAMQQPWRIWVNISQQHNKHININTIEQSTAEPCAYFMEGTCVYCNIWPWLISQSGNALPSREHLLVGCFLCKGWPLGYGELANIGRDILARFLG